MTKDKEGNDLNVGDVVTIACKVLGVSEPREGEEHGDLIVQPLNDDATLPINSREVVKQG